MFEWTSEGTCTNKYAGTLASCDGETLYTKNPFPVTSELISGRDLQRKQDFYCFDKRISKYQLDDVIKEYKSKINLQKKLTNVVANRGRQMRRVQSIKPSDDDYVARKVREVKNPPIRRNIINETPDKPKADHIIPSDPKKAAKERLGKAKVSIQLPDILCKLRLSSDDSFENLKEVTMRSSRGIKVSYRAHNMLRQPLLIVGNNQQKLNEIRQRGKEFIASTGPPLVFGERRVGWMREYFTPESKRADVIYARGFPLSMKYFKKDYLFLYLRSEKLRAEKKAWFGWEKLHKALHAIAVFKTFEMRDFWNDDDDRWWKNQEVTERMRLSLDVLGRKSDRSPFTQLEPANKKKIVLTAMTTVVVERLQMAFRSKFTAAFLNDNHEWFNNCLNYAAQDLTSLLRAMDEKNFARST